MAVAESCGREGSGRLPLLRRDVLQGGRAPTACPNPQGARWRLRSRLLLQATLESVPGRAGARARKARAARDRLSARPQSRTSRNRARSPTSRTAPWPRAAGAPQRLTHQGSAEAAMLARAIDRERPPASAPAARNPPRHATGARCRRADASPTADRGQPPRRPCGPGAGARRSCGAASEPRTRIQQPFTGWNIRLDFIANRDHGRDPPKARSRDENQPSHPPRRGGPSGTGDWGNGSPASDLPRRAKRELDHVGFQRRESR